MIHTAQQIAEMFMLPLEQIEQWAKEDKIMYARLDDGTLLIPLGAFQTMLPSIYDLENDLAALNEASDDIDPELIEEYFRNLDD